VGWDELMNAVSSSGELYLGAILKEALVNAAASHFSEYRLQVGASNAFAENHFKDVDTQYKKNDPACW
jgi:hypothetical protein